MTIKKTKAQLRNDLAETTRMNILEVATQEFADKGLAGARIDEIAEKTDSSKRMIYYYFGGKDGLYRAVLERAYVGIREREAAHNFDAMDAVTAMQTLVHHTFDYHDQHPEFVRLVMNENILHGAHVSEIDGIKERNRRVIGTIQTILDRGTTEGVFRDGIDPLALHMSMTSMSFYCVSNRYTVKANFGLDLGKRAVKAARRDQIADMILSAVRR